MSAYLKDLAVRTIATPAAALLGVLLVELGDLSVWWALPVAAVVTVVRVLVVSTDSWAALRANLVERTLWTLAQVTLAAVPVALWGVAPGYVPLIAAVLAILKGAVAKKVGDPNTAATLPAPKPDAPALPSTSQPPHAAF